MVKMTYLRSRDWKHSLLEGHKHSCGVGVEAREPHTSKGQIWSGNKGNKLAFGNILPILVFSSDPFTLIPSLYLDPSEYLWGYKKCASVMGTEIKWGTSTPHPAASMDHNFLMTASKLSCAVDHRMKHFVNTTHGLAHQGQDILWPSHHFNHPSPSPSHFSASSAWHTSAGKKLLLPPSLFGMKLGIKQIKSP